MATRTTKEAKITEIRWANRVRMAWVSLIVFALYTLLYWFALPAWLSWMGVSLTWITAIQDSYFWFATGMIAVVLGYMGFTTLPFIGKNGAPIPTVDRFQEEVDEDDVAPRKKKASITPDENYVDPNFKFNGNDL